MVLATRGWEAARGIPFDNYHGEALYPENCALSSGPAQVSLERLLGAQAPHPPDPRNLLLRRGGRGLGPQEHSSGAQRLHKGACVSVPA